ncbi:hypothetical protein AK812_SmicGene45384 [Symbiodinium microadriaticum]|uniref:Uncharacterized protein n=1 Tax=Symbiodinium microadriaticum TaxID=2951 RepID=A0A1Q9BW88_SYMMI|nr:hypothetical protein AK812_SmicGene45384 [Symbiodinium microadriaticum]
MGVSSVLEGTEQRQSSKKALFLCYVWYTVLLQLCFTLVVRQLAARGSLTDLLSGLGPLPPLDTLREEMRDFSPKDRVSGSQFFAAQWKLQQTVAKEAGEKGLGSSDGSDAYEAAPA